MQRIVLLGFLVLLATLGATPPCNGTGLSITSVAVKNVSSSGNLNTYHISGTVTNTGSQAEPNSALQSVDIFMAQEKLDAKSIPPLAAGQSYTFDYAYQRSNDAGNGTTHLRFSIDLHQAGADAGCRLARGTYELTF